MHYFREGTVSRPTNSHSEKMASATAGFAPGSELELGDYSARGVVEVAGYLTHGITPHLGIGGRQDVLTVDLTPKREAPLSASREVRRVHTKELRV